MRALGASRTSLVPGGVLAGPWVRDDLWRRARAVPSLDLRFADNKSLVDAVTGASLVTFNRASNGTFTNSAGVLQTAVTNLLLRSEEFDDASWNKAGLLAFGSGSTANAIAAPNGTITADLLTENTSNFEHIISQNVSSPVASVLSAYIKPNGRSWVVFQMTFTGASIPAVGERRVWIDLTNKTAGTTGSTWSNVTVNDVGNGWLRVSATCNPQPSNSFIAIANILMSTGDQVVTYTGDGTSGIYLWGAQLEQSTTVGEYIPTTSAINSAPRFDHNPITGESLGLLVEEQRTNSIVNSNSMTAVVTGSPGTLPTGWSAQGNAGGWTREVVGSGSLGSLNYVDIRFSGTPTAGTLSVNFQGQGVVAASNGQTWTPSVYHQLVGGAISNITGFPAANLWNSTPSFIGGLAIVGTIVPTSTLQRFSGSNTIGLATTAFISWGITFTCTIGNTYDFTIRFAGPQLEQGASPTSYIPTTTAAVTRSADVASITGSNFSSWFNAGEGTLFGAASVQTVAAYSGYVAEIGSFNDGFLMFRQSDSQPVLRIRVGGADQYLNGFGTIWTTTGAFRNVMAYKADDFAGSINGGALGIDTSGTLPSVSSLQVGRTGSTAYLNGHIRRLTYWPTRLSNATLQTITQ